MHPMHPMQPYINLYIFLIQVYASMHPMLHGIYEYMTLTIYKALRLGWARGPSAATTVGTIDN